MDDGTVAPGREPIGTWRCLFAVLGNEPPLVAAVTYYFSFGETGDDLEHSMLIVQGLNSHAPEGSVPRYLDVVGGTGKFSGARGEVLEEVLGLDPDDNLTQRFSFELKKEAHGPTLRHPHHRY